MIRNFISVDDPVERKKVSLDSKYGQNVIIVNRQIQQRSIALSESA